MDIRKYFKPTNNSVLNEKTPLLDKSKFKLNYIKPNKKRTFEIFTDGSTFNNGNKTKLQFGGIGVYFNNNEFPYISEALTGKITNNIAEIKACLAGIKRIETLEEFKSNPENDIHIYTDSQYTINSIVKWCPGWEKNNWLNKVKRKANKELIMELYSLYKKYKIKLYM